MKGKELVALDGENALLKTHINPVAQLWLIMYLKDLVVCCIECKITNIEVTVNRSRLILFNFQSFSLTNIQNVG